jgi:hypothetical protein
VPSPLYPQAIDLSGFLESGGLTLDDEQIAVAVTAGIEAFQREAGRHMLAGRTVDNEAVAAYTRTFAPPANRTGYLDFDADLAGAPTLVQYAPAGATAETFVVATDYRLEPLNAARDRRPYEGMVLRRRWWSPLGMDYTASIEVTGNWGYGTTLPDDAWAAMLRGAVLYLLDMHALSVVGFAAGWKVADESETFSKDSIKGPAEAFQKTFDTAVARYKKVSL